MQLVLEMNTVEKKNVERESRDSEELPEKQYATRLDHQKAIAKTFKLKSVLKMAACTDGPSSLNDLGDAA